MLFDCGLLTSYLSTYLSVARGNQEARRIWGWRKRGLLLVLDRGD